MRCEICGAPVSKDDTVCELCATERMSSVPEEPKQPSEELGASGFARKVPSRPPTGGFRGRLPLPGSGSSFSLSRSVILEDKYKLGHEIGRGAMGTVFVAEDVTLKRQVAVKFLLPELSGSPDCAERFHHEAIGMAAIRDNNVAQIYSYGRHGEIPYFVMEYLEGDTMERIVDVHNQRGFFIPLKDAMDILVQSVSGLASIHRASAVHRDIKPANIMLTDDPVRAVIMDFGLVRSVQVEDEVRVLAGTPAYIAPELVEGHADADRSPLTDIYSMGTTAYEILTGSLPFKGETWVEILRKHITEMPNYPSERRPGIPDELDEILMRAMNKDPRERYQSCDEFLDDLIQVENLSAVEERSSSIPSDNRPITQRLGSSKRLRSNPPQSAIRSTPSTGRGRLLVVDEDSDFRSMVHDTAKAVVPNCRIQSATDGAIALHMIKDFRPHVLVIDLSLPQVNGLEVVATLRGDPDYEEVEVIVTSQSGGSPEANILSGLRVSHFLTKPIDIDTLASVLLPMLENPVSLLRR